MYRYLYIILICLFSDIFCQETNGDTFFLDMGVVIKSENEKTNLNGLIDRTPVEQSNHVIQKKFISRQIQSKENLIGSEPD